MIDQRLLTQVTRLIQENSNGAGISPSSLVRADPTLEPIQRATELRLPEFAERIRECETPEEFDEWACVADLKSLLERRGEHWLRDELIHRLRTSGQPGDAVLCVAELLGRRIVPPPRTPAWQRRDAAGSLLAMLLLTAVAMLRITVFAGLSSLLTYHSPARWSILATWFGSPLMLGSFEATVLSVVLLMLASSYILLELWLAVPAAEFLRRQPIRQGNLPQNVPWRIDPLYFAYLIVSMATWWGLVTRAWIESCWSVFTSGEIHVLHCAALLFVCACLISLVVEVCIRASDVAIGNSRQFTVSDGA